MVRFQVWRKIHLRPFCSLSVRNKVEQEVALCKRYSVLLPIGICIRFSSGRPFNWRFFPRKKRANDGPVHGRPFALGVWASPFWCCRSDCEMLCWLNQTIVVPSCGLGFWSSYSIVPHVNRVSHRLYVPYIHQYIMYVDYKHMYW